MNNAMIKAVAILLLLPFFVMACSHVGKPDQTAMSVSIMTFNVENLFDTQHDQNKDDYTYLPLDKKQSAEHKERCNRISVNKWRDQCLNWDWNESALDNKMKKLATVIRQVNGGKGPDIIAFQEVENYRILNRLRVDYLADLGYLEPLLVEGNDLRGIDVAFLARLPVVSEPVLHQIDFREIEKRRLQDTRGILQADFQLPDGQILTGYAVHFPAPFHPYPLRIDSYQTLDQLVASLPPGRVAFAAGDFNTPRAEDLQHGILDSYASKSWHIAHQLGCQDCPGTHYYAPKKEWSFLDMILVRKRSAAVTANSTWSMDASRTRLAISFDEQIDENGFPNEYNSQTLTGVSDHLPLVVEIARQ